MHRNLWQPRNCDRGDKFHGFSLHRALTQLQQGWKCHSCFRRLLQCTPRPPLTGYSIQFFFALFSLQTVSLLSQRKLFSQATHYPFLIAAPQIFIKSTENCGVNRFIFKLWRYVWRHCASVTPANQLRSEITWYARPRIQRTNNSQNQQTRQFSAHETSLFLMNAKTLAYFYLSCLYTVSKMCIFYSKLPLNHCPLTWPR